MQRAKRDQVFVLLSSGFDESEVSMVVRILRKSGFPVVVVGLASGPLRGAYGLSFVPDRTLTEVETARPQAIVLPGGIQGARQLDADPRVHSLLLRVVDQGGYVLALDASDAILYSAGVLERAATDASPARGGRRSSDRQVIVEEQSIWGCGLGAVQEATLALMALLQGERG